MGVKHPKPHIAEKHKTHHQTGYRKEQKKPTTNYAPDTHARFCKRCIMQNGYCLSNGTDKPDRDCKL